MNSLSVFDEDGLLSESLEKTTKEYRLYDPGWYLYRMIMRYSDDKFTSDFVQLVYVTLCAWNMNSRGAKLSEYDDFEKSVFSYAELLRDLSEYEIQQLDGNVELREHLKDLFFGISFVEKGKPVLVTASKTLHFFLPKLIVPIDRKYTLQFFNGNMGVPTNDINKQFRMFIDIQNEFSAFSTSHNLEEYIDDRWNLSIPKVMDNMIIGFMKL